MQPVDHTALMDIAAGAASNAYAPYSEFSVGAALLCDDGSVVRGCNVESASYGLTICAERVALASALADGRRSFVAIAIHVSGPDGQPCGACRQMLSEHAPDLQVAYRSSGETVVQPIAALLPDAFRPASLP